MRYYFGLGVGHTYAYNSAPPSLDQLTTDSEGSQDIVEDDLDAENVNQSGPENDAPSLYGSDLERSVDDESSDSNSDNLGDGNESDRDVESEDEDFVEMYYA